MEEINWKGQQLLLHHYKAIYWWQEKALLIADAHLGKVSHFRKAGLAIPNSAGYQNLFRLEELLKTYNPEKVIFLGDLFHSEMNLEWMSFKKLLKKYCHLQFILVQGNHDILHELSYQQCGMELVDELNMGPFNFTHDPKPHPTLYNLCGHIHPGVLMSGLGKQSLRLPCFYFGEHNGILPAFGEFTGLHMMKPVKNDRIYLVVNQKIIKAA